VPHGFLGGCEQVERVDLERMRDVRQAVQAEAMYAALNVVDGADVQMELGGQLAHCDATLDAQVFEPSREWRLRLRHANGHSHRSRAVVERIRRATESNRFPRLAGSVRYAGFHGSRCARQIAASGSGRALAALFWRLYYRWRSPPAESRGRRRLAK
jgi:hypothetical protein